MIEGDSTELEERSKNYHGMASALAFGATAQGEARRDVSPVARTGPGGGVRLSDLVRRVVCHVETTTLVPRPGAEDVHTAVFKVRPEYACLLAMTY